MDKVVDHLFVFEGQASIRDFPGNYTQYREKKSSEDKAKKQAEAKVKSEAEKGESSAPKEKTKLTYGERLEFEKLEGEIFELETKKDELAEKLSSTSSNDELMKLSAELDSVVKEIDSKTERWMELAQWVE
jgi:ATP-binding cassette subfamily F protein uup